MAKTPDQKAKLLILRELLLQESDEDHPIPIEQMQAALAQQDISGERKSLYRDLEMLRHYGGLDVQNRKGAHPGWYIGARQFELAEVKLLLDLVQSSKFLTRKKGDALIKKLETLASAPQAKLLQRQVFVSRRVKSENETIYYTVDQLHSALAQQKTVEFQYFEYDREKKRVLRHGGQFYRVFPLGLICEDSNYYLVGVDQLQNELRHYRVDRMLHLRLADASAQPSAPRPDFNIADYAKLHFGMFHGESVALKLRFENDLSGAVFDRFGHDAMLIPDGDSHFTLTAQVAMSPQLWGWVFGLGGKVQVCAPPAAVAHFQAQLAQVQALYAEPSST